MKLQAPEQKQLEVRRERQGGFSFLELLVSVAILAILSGVSAVTWVGYQREQALDAGARDMLSALHEAQGQALGRIDANGDGVPDQFGVRITNVDGGNSYIEYFYGDAYIPGNVIRRSNLEYRVELTAPPEGDSYDFVYQARSAKLDTSSSTPLDPDCPLNMCGGACLDVDMYNVADPTQQLTLRVWEHGGTEINPEPLNNCPS